MNVLSQLQAALAERYAIEREIGRGGMATVYLARDVKHHRQVAVKVLDPELGAVLGVDRFLSEIRVTANLQHPNLLPLFDSGEANGLLFYVMPFVEGETLRHRLERDRQLSIDEAIRIATAIAGALDYAHRHGVIHRDLKPENILLHDGQPLVADFGIALAVSKAGGQRITQTGLSLGTPQYMSPEQATGDREIDGRTDIYSLGAITYEMLAGEPPHFANSAQAIIARLMTEDPRPLSVLRRSVPPHIEDAVHCALQKLPADRFATAKEFAESLGGASRAMTLRSVRSDATATVRTWRRAFWIAAAVALVGLAGVAWMATRPVPERSVVRFRVDDDARPVALQGTVVAVSGDGTSITYVARSDSTPQLMTRRPGDLESIPFTGAGDLRDLTEFRWSNDGRWLVMKVGLRILRMPASGGAPVVMTSDVQSRYGGLAVTDDGDAIYTANGGLMLARPSASPTLLAQPDTARGEQSLGAPLVLPDGKHVAFSILRRRDTGLTDPTLTLAPRNLGTVRLDGGGRRSFELPIANPIGYVDGWLVYGTPAAEINAVQFDPSDGVKGAPIAVLTGVSVSVNFAGEVQASLSPAGTFAYARFDFNRSIVVLDANGVALSHLPERGPMAHPTWSPDGGRVAFDVDSAIWVYDVASKSSLRLTTEKGGRPAWTPDGKRIGFVSARSELWWVPADGSAREDLLFRPVGGAAREVGFTPDGRSVLFRFDRTSPSAVRLVRDIQIAPIGGGESRALIANGYANTQAVVSPDGQWIAYSSDETRRGEVYVRAFAGGGRVPVSVGGGIEPRWVNNTQLVYRTRPGRAFWRATLSPGPGGAVVTRRDSLFADPYVLSANNPQSYDVSRNGRFLVVRDESGGASLVAVVNWVTELRKILGSR